MALPAAALLLLATCLWSGPSACGELPSRFTLQAGRFSPGMTAVVRFLPSPGLEARSLEGLGQKASFHTGRGVPPWALLAVALSTPPGPQPVQATYLDHGQLVRETLTLEVAGTEPPLRSLTIRALKPRLLRSLARESRIQKKALNRPESKPQWKGLFGLPVTGRISENFGVRRDYNEGTAFWQHKGVDLASPLGTPVRAANGGTVGLAQKMKAYGGSVIIDHGGRLSTSYFHLSKVLVRRGQKVRKGQVLGLVGAEGIATGPHLHWQMNLNGIPVDPMQWLPRAQVEQIKNVNEGRGM